MSECIFIRQCFDYFAVLHQHNVSVNDFDGFGTSFYHLITDHIRDILYACDLFSDIKAGVFSCNSEYYLFTLVCVKYGTFIAYTCGDLIIGRCDSELVLILPPYVGRTAVNGVSFLHHISAGA